MMSEMDMGHGQELVQECQLLDNDSALAPDEIGARRRGLLMRAHRLGYDDYFRGRDWMPVLLAPDPMLGSAWEFGHAQARLCAAHMLCRCACHEWQRCAVTARTCQRALHGRGQRPWMRTDADRTGGRDDTRPV